MRKEPLLTYLKEKIIYADAIVTSVHEDSYDIQFSDGKMKKYVQNSSNIQFYTGNFVSVLISGGERDNYRIIGKGKKVNLAYQIQTVVV